MDRTGLASTRVGLRFDPIAEAARQWSSHGWRSAARGMALVTSIARAQQLFANRIDRVLRPLGLTFARYEVLMILLFSQRGSLPLGRIGARLQVQPGAVTNAVDRLEADGLVRRVQHPTDGRTTLAEITPQGRALAERATALLNTEVFEAPWIDDREASDVISVLRTLREQAGDFRL